MDREPGLHRHRSHQRHCTLEQLFPTTSGLPPGLSAAANVNSAGNISSIFITGTPTATGTYNAQLVLRGVSGAAIAGRNYTITINAIPTLGTLSQTQWTVGPIGRTPVRSQRSGGTGRADSRQPGKSASWPHG